MSIIDPIGPRPVDPANRQLAPPAVRERYLDESQREREQRRQRRRRKAPEDAGESEGSSDHVDVRV